jgi:hypothetical protein
MKSIFILMALLASVSLFAGCPSSHPPYPNDELLITHFKKNKQLFSELVVDPENRKLLSSLGIKRVMIHSSEPKLIRYETWFHDLFGPGGCMKGYAYSSEELPCVKSIDQAITSPCGPEEKDLFQKIQGKWYLYYVSSN